jgi:hypothetical protein
MKKLLAVILLTCVTLSALQAQRLKKPRQPSKKDVFANMYKTANYGDLKAY